MPLDLQAIKARLTNATPGPWEVGYGEFDSGTSVYIEDSEVSSKFWRVDAEFIANARQDVPALIAEVERLRKGLEKIEKNTSDKAVQRIARVTLDPTEYERYKKPGDPF